MLILYLFYRFRKSITEAKEYLVIIGYPTFTLEDFYENVTNLFAETEK